MKKIMKYLKPAIIIAILFLLAMILEKQQNPLSYVPVYSVNPVVETQPKTALEDGDDPCIWIHPTDREKSTIICSDKDQGIAVYDLSGQEIQFLHLGQINNIDIRRSFPFQNRRIDLIAASNRTTSSIELYTVDSDTRMLEKLPSAPIQPNLSEIYGLCLYKSHSQKYYAFVTSTTGRAEQWEIFEGQNGEAAGKLVRQFKVSSKAEGCVADDELGFFYLAEEEKGIWKFNAEPDGGEIGVLIAHINPHLLPDIEGLTIYYGQQPGIGYIIASSQGSNRFTVLDRVNNHDLIAQFQIDDHGDIDGAEHTDGIDICSKNLGASFPEGIFVVQDGLNRDGDETNFKFVSVAEILANL